ncbi:hypothetical protein GPECTOR_17g865 [Gonium pectorale]|uniref:PhoD-like phosphatase domain-containing protein n=1 Tax=Gonium pectorale TaxID=33097 RepID=A0A150GK97_GONPE|nr:hypothetical protein GPECTOR_17g865 [Gonium pectorale]|eukprot:KXZ50228.1 hypothetical protein GPECTOR_17g865 [Gonium pectorale]
MRLWGRAKQLGQQGQTLKDARCGCSRHAVAVAEATEGIASTDDIHVTASAPSSPRPPEPEKADVADNTCCGHELAAPYTAGPFVKFWRLEREDAPERAPGGIGYPSFRISESAPPPVSHALGQGAQNLDGPDQIRVWVGTILLVTKADPAKVEVKVTSQKGQVFTLGKEEIDKFAGWRALRFWVKMVVEPGHNEVQYSVKVDDAELRLSDGSPFSIHIAGSSQPTHWGYYSCSGFSLDVPAAEREGTWRGMAPLWQDVWNVHKEKPMHLLVGGGDQLYNDDVWQLKILHDRFLSLPRATPDDRKKRAGTAMDSAMQVAVEAYYFHHYAVHFSQPVVRDVYACVPQVMTWDDHDIFDGWGSYPDHLQQSKVFKGIFEAARRWYCVFQQHCRPEEKEPVAVYELGGRTAIVACDQREKRMPDQVLPLEHYMRFSLLCTQLPKGIEHVVFVSTVPVVYPHIRGARSVLRISSNNVVAGLLAKLGKSPMNIFGEPELMDDLDDHWSADSHEEERRFLIEHLQMLAKYRGCRVTLLSGDVHVAGTGRLVSTPRPTGDLELRYDFRYMPQIISSAIANPPPPTGLLKVLEAFSASGKVNKHTKHQMTRVIRTKVGNVGKPLENKRNWCEVEEQKLGLPDMELNGSLTFRLRIEDAPGSTEPVRKFALHVPPLDTYPSGEYFDVHSVPLIHRGPLRCCFAA